MPHALAVADFAEKYSVSRESGSDIYQQVGEYLRQQAEYKKAENIILHAIDIRKEVLGDQHEKLAKSFDYLESVS